MKILQVIPYYPPAESFGGPPQVFYNLGKEFTKRGHQLSVFTTDAANINDWSDRISESDTELDGILVHRFKRLPWSALLPSKFLKLATEKISEKYLQELADFNIIHISDVTHPLAMIFSSYARKLGVPYVISVFGNLTPVKNPLLQFQKNIFMWCSGNKILQNASALLVQTPHEAEICDRYTTSEKIVLMPLPVDIKPFRLLPAAGTFRQKYQIPNSEKIVLFLGRVHRYKGIQTVIDCMPQLVKKLNGNIRLIIAGTDEGYQKVLFSQAIKLGIIDKTLFLGSTFGNAKLEVLRDTDVFVTTPITWEETSLAALEACACGIPSIITEKNAIPGLEEYNAGFQTASDNVEQLVNSLISLLTDDQLRNTMGRNAKKLIEEKYSVEKVTEILESQYQKIINEKR